MKLVHKLFEKAVHENHNKIALVMNEHVVTYQELDLLSNQIANRLVNQGVHKNDIVGLCKRRSIDMIASMIAILKIGASYLPLDPEYPKDRLRFMLEHAKAKKVIIDDDLKNVFSGFENSLFLNTKQLIDEEIKFNSSNDANLCYIIYTSGSTGKPKAVAMGHGPLVNLLEWQNKETELKSESICLQFTPISFDVHFQEIFSTLSLGGTLVLINEETRLNTVKLLKTIIEKNVNRLYLPFVALNHMAEVAVKNSLFPTKLNEVTTAGEQLKITSNIVLFFEKLQSAKLFNHYGPSETHVVTSKCLTNDPKKWPALPSIGSEIDNCKLLILDEKFNEVYDGEVGELYIAGNVLANGYLYAEDLTNERFLNTKYGRVYKTGDLGRRLKNNEIDFLGRSDSQVKIRGYRIEPGEIEIQISNLMNGKKAFVKVINDDVVGSYLCAYLLEQDQIDLNKLKSDLKNKIPEYMIPRTFMTVEDIPLTPSGKVDYKILPNPKLERPDLMNEFIPPFSDVEKELYKIWFEYLKIEKIGIDDSFFDLGGNSLSAIKMLIDINSQFNCELTITNIFELRTIRNLARKIQNEENDDEILLNNDQNIFKDKIAIIGMSGRFPESHSVEEFWNNLIKVKNTIKPFDKKDLNHTVPKDLANSGEYVFYKAEFPDQEYFDNKFFGITPREAQLKDPQQRKFLELCYEALEKGGVASSKFKGSIGVFAGMGNSKYSKLVEANPKLVNNLGEFNVMLGLEKDYISTNIAYKLNLKGPAISVHTACSTSLVAIIEAVNHLRLRNCDVALAGGIAISGLKNVGHMFNEGGILTKDGTCRPYDQNATGTIFSDGGGVVVLKRLSDAERDNDNIIAVISGVGINNDGADKVSFMAPSVSGQRLAILRAQKDAGIEAIEVGMVEGHGTATPVGDPIEVEALTSAFKKTTNEKQFCLLTSLKSNFGHLTAAAGVASVIKAALAVKYKKIPGTCHFNSYNSFINFNETPFKVTNQTTEFKANHKNKFVAAVSSFGVGGTNAHLIIENYDKLRTQDDQTSRNSQLQILRYSAKSTENLEDLKNRLISFINHHPDDLSKLAYTLDKGRNDFNFRNCLIVDPENIASSITDKEHFVLNKGEFKNHLAFVFPGQGSHYSSMGKSLYESNIIFKNNMDQVFAIYQQMTNNSLKDIIWSEKSDDNLSNTKYSQPGIFAIEYSLGKMFLQMGVRPNVFVGHSIGEFAVLALTEVVDLESALMLVINRAQLMQKLEPGKMISANLSKSVATQLAKKFNVDIAAFNLEESVVFSGNSYFIDSLKDHLESESIASIELKTSHAFHSKMMEPMIEEFGRCIDGVKFSRPNYKIIKTSVNDYEFWDKEYWIEHVLRPVDFYSAAISLLQEKSLFILEIGPREILSRYIRKIKNHNSVSIGTLANNLENENRNILKVFATLWTYGLYEKSFDWNYSELDRKTIEAPSYPFNKTYHWLDTEKVKEETMTQTKDLQLKKRLAEIFEATSGIEIDDQNYSTSFLELGMDSLFLTQISMQLKKEMKINIGFRQLLETYDNINKLCEQVINSVDENIYLKNTTPIETKTSIEKVEVKEERSIPIVDKQAVIAPITTPINLMSTMNLSRSIETPKNLMEVVSKQLDLMNQQLLLLSGNALSISNVTTTEKEQVTNNITNVTIPSAPIVSDLKKQRGVDVRKSKDSFGAQAKIVVEKTTQFDSQTQNKIKEFCHKYNEKTKLSKKFAQDNRVNHADPRVVTGFKPESKEVVYPIVSKKSYLQNLWDLDGNQYIDMTCGFGSNFFGNGNDRIKKYVLAQIEEGIEIGPQHPLVSEVSKLVNELTGNERTAFCNTGSEAVLGAMRLARTVTGREKIIVFSGSYHGINDEVIIRGSKNLNSIPAAPGINTSAVSSMIVLDYGTEETLEYIRKHAEDVAAVLVEPVQSRRSDFHPKDFLQEVRKITLETKTCLIFDEIITGFRIHPAGAQGHFGIRADLCTYGKIVGGGMPIGLISGKTEYMDALDGGFWQYGDESTPTVGVTYFAGTFVRHPLALAAAKGALEILKEGGHSLYQNLNSRSQKFVDNINKMLKENNVPLKMDNFGSLMKPKWVKEIPSGDLFFVALRYNGIHTYDGFPWFVNLAHTERDLEVVLDSFQKSIKMMQEIGVFENVGKTTLKMDVDTNHLVASGPPVVGAKLGKDENGNPAWFVEDPKYPGEFYKVK